MEYFIAFCVFLFGVIIGSFLNVVILRYNTGTSIGGRSFCFSCGKILRWFELVPLFSFLVQTGKCRSCRSPISWQYPLVEALTGVLFVLGAYQFNFALENIAMILFTWLILAILIVISVYDIRHKIIPDMLSLLFALFSLGNLIATFRGGILSYPHFLDLLAGPILFAPFFCLWFFSGGRWMGLGDGKLVVGIGWLLGLSGGISAVILGFWIGAGVSLFILLLQRFALFSGSKHLTMKSEIPFGPFLILGTLLVLFWGFDVIGLKYLLMM